MSRLTRSFLLLGAVLASLALCNESMAQRVGGGARGFRSGSAMPRRPIVSTKRLPPARDAIVTSGRLRRNPDAIVSTDDRSRLSNAVKADYGRDWARPSMRRAGTSVVAPVGGFGGYGGGFGYGFGGISPYGIQGLNGRAYSSGRIPTPPYFSLHPPVYYSQAVPRTYGYSPFAYPVGSPTPDVVKSAQIINPHVKPSEPEAKDASVKTASASQTAPKSQVVWNPYADSTIDIGFVRNEEPVQQGNVVEVESQITQEQPEVEPQKAVSTLEVASVVRTQVLENPFTVSSN